jgi:predicted 3-demethylubiquinone-9 3-methyltransferase (glyoxalase superfamily)
MTIAFELDGRPFVGLNGGPIFKFTEAVSFSIGCDTQAEIDHYWDSLSDGGQPGPCGWLKDRWGLSWQVVPSILPELLKGGGERAGRVMAVVLASSKLDIAALKAAYDG